MKRIIIGLVLIASHADAQTYSLFQTQTPAVPVDSDTAAVTLGFKFYTTQAGTVSAIKFYRAARNGNGYTVKLFTAAGTLLGSVAVPRDPTNGFVSGWKTATFAAPISLAANTTYIAAYYTSNGRYAATNDGLTTGATSGPLIAPASNASGGNGVYTYSTGFPTQTYQASNYFVDVVFAPTTQTPQLLMSFNPAQPSISSDAAVGTTVTTVNVTWSDGRPFTGTLGFTSPYSNDNGKFALSGKDLIIAGPGIAGDGGSTQNVSLQATQ